tara:strand:+ start:723 stop:1247 length:525 start_codon:yes stop_codon:yes gene_type:complete
MTTGPYKDKMGRYRTQSLFHEFSYMRKPDDDFNPIYTLKNVPTSNLPCLKDIYMDSNDPTEYTFAIQAFNSWDQWQKIKNNKALQPYLEGWNEELEVKLRSKAMSSIVKEAVSGKSSFNAAKFLATGEWKRQHTRGRPSKIEIEKEKKIQAKLAEEFDSDAERIGLQLVNTGEK